MVVHVDPFKSSSSPAVRSGEASRAASGQPSGEDTQRVASEPSSSDTNSSLPTFNPVVEECGNGSQIAGSAHPPTLE
ncbi:hypothetical protein PILCRDRAFT_3145 [Piloderma croceum F 1598]|uniref:Uncharacterized protein n=1 Tax=Piloderma croceum (strain F 1598) TaxID=765440 RepID=A0A0C3FUQ1_PILCF|nr:hypothetical protein PILCRDRAFT_3145 [Piloderma croceum F 1598]